MSDLRIKCREKHLDVREIKDERRGESDITRSFYLTWCIKQKMKWNQM
jgi:hypothetical protein